MAEAEGIPPTASVASVGPGIRYVGNYVYALSGGLEAKLASQDMLDFTTGSGIIVGEFTLNGQARFTSPTTGGSSNFEILFNDQVIGSYKTNTTQQDMPNQNFQKVVIPPRTRVVVRCISDEDTATELLTSSLVGRVYGAA